MHAVMHLLIIVEEAFCRHFDHCGYFLSLRQIDSLISFQFLHRHYYITVSAGQIDLNHFCTLISAGVFDIEAHLYIVFFDLMTEIGKCKCGIA